MPVHSWREKFKRQWFVREPAEVVFGKVEEKKKIICLPYIGFSIYRIKYWTYIFCECFIAASYLPMILFLKKTFFSPLKGPCALFLLQYSFSCSHGVHENSGLVLVKRALCDSSGKAQKGLTVVFPTNRSSMSRLRWKLVHYEIIMSRWNNILLCTTSLEHLSDVEAAAHGQSLQKSVLNINQAQLLPPGLCVNKWSQY